MSQERPTKSAHEQDTSEVEAVDHNDKAAEGLAKTAAKKAELDEATDSLLEDIDDILESNAEEFVAGFVQKGGE